MSVKAISNLNFALSESEQKNLLKLYLNDVGLLTAILYDTNINAILQDENSVNLGSVYESIVHKSCTPTVLSFTTMITKRKGRLTF